MKLPLSGKGEGGGGKQLLFNPSNLLPEVRASRNYIEQLRGQFM